MPQGPSINWTEIAGDLAKKVRPETRSKYFPKNPLRQVIINRFLQRLSLELAGFEWKALLDLGCGEGFVDHFLSFQFPARSITGVEPDAEVLEVARAINPGYKYICADGRDLPLADRSFDALICIEVLEHMPDFHRVIEEAARVSIGPCIFTVPACPWYQATNFMIGKNWKRLGEHPDHVVRFTKSLVKNELAQVFDTKVSVTLVYPWLMAVCDSGRQQAGK